MRERLKHFFIPHAGNEYHPHMLHTKRAVMYGGLFVVMKVIVILFVLLVPAEVYVMPDMLAQQEQAVLSLTNDVRTTQGVSPLHVDKRLVLSASQKGTDMASHGYFAHTSPDGVGLASWLDGVAYPYHVAGENLAIGFTDPRAMVRAWVESPTHFANIIDAQYEDTGIHLVSGLYDGEQVVFAVQHFGVQKKDEASIASITEAEGLHTFVPAVEPVPSVSVDSATFGDVLGTQEDVVPGAQGDSTEETSEYEPDPISSPGEPKALPFLDRERSLVSYEVIEGEHPQLRISAHAGINAPYASAVVHIGATEILLEQGDIYGIAQGSTVIDESEESYFRAVLVPQLRILLPDGTLITEPLRWEHIPKVSLTPVEQYTTSKPLLGSITSLFHVTNSIYFFFVLLFTIALLIHILWEVKIQHHHVTVQTLGLILLLMTLIAV